MPQKGRKGDPNLRHYMLRKTLLMLALAAAPTLAAQQPTQQPVASKSNASQTADTSKAKHKSKSSKKSHTAKPATAAPAAKDTAKAKP